ncbi:MAG TPA: hypothetical protein VLH16_07405 [Bacteroidales bacterium]|nr:hypothetical protein [Bacteroidales bacterium]
MKKFAIAFFLVLVFIGAKGQDTTMVITNERLRELDRDIQELKTFVRDQKTEHALTEKEEYQRNYHRLITMAELLIELRNSINLIENDKKQLSVFNTLNQANNPASSILGFKLTDVVMQSFEETINNKNLAPEQAFPMRNIVRNLIHGLGETFPPLQLVSSVISSVSSFTHFSVAPPAPANNRRIRFASDIAIRSLTSTVDSSFIGTYTRKLQPYILFYMELNRINTRFEEDLAEFSFHYADMAQNLNNLISEFELNTTLNLSQGNITHQVNSLMNFQNSGTERFRHRDYNRMPQLIYTSTALEKVSEFVKTFNEYARQYAFLTNRNMENNLRQLANAKILPNSNAAEIDRLIAQIRLNHIGTEAQPGFISRYNRNINSITTKLQQIRVR